VDENYLGHWTAPDAFGDQAVADQPVTQVSWFAALAYCEARDARLPSWAEWEYVAAADETRRDARADPAWRERILSWYSRSSAGALAPVGKTPANVHGVRSEERRVGQERRSVGTTFQIHQTGLVRPV